MNKPNPEQAQLPPCPHDKILRDCRSAIASLPEDALGRDPQGGWFYRDELLAKIDGALASPLPAEGVAEERCVECGHSDALDPNGECMHVERDAGGSLVYCHHRCTFSRVEQPQDDQLVSLFHAIWISQVGTEGYSKKDWQKLANMLRERGIEVQLASSPQRIS